MSKQERLEKNVVDASNAAEAAYDANTAYREITSEAELIERYRVLVTLSN
mgnify:CR=1 FL=1